MLTVSIKTKSGSVNELISPREENKVDRDTKVIGILYNIPICQFILQKKKTRLEQANHLKISQATNTTFFKMNDL